VEASDALQFEERRVEELRTAEAWFRSRGLPWFVEAVDERVRALLNRRWIWPLVVAVVAVAVGVGWLVGYLVEDVAAALLVAVLVALGLLLAYAGGPLRVAVMARWAARRVLAELDLLLPLVTRVLFMTFLFINTEVWQVASALRRSNLYAVVLLFSGLGVAFLLTRLPEEVREVQRSAAGEALVRACRGTPLAERAERLAAAPR
jgi:hypothetical protein